MHSGRSILSFTYLLIEDRGASYAHLSSLGFEMQTFNFVRVLHATLHPTHHQKVNWWSIMLTADSTCQ